MQQNLQNSNYSYIPLVKLRQTTTKSYYNDFKINFKTGDVIAQKASK
jgi:hypothetical protein